jgi:hypothetical protein
MIGMSSGGVNISTSSQVDAMNLDLMTAIKGVVQILSEPVSASYLVSPAMFTVEALRESILQLHHGQMAAGSDPRAQSTCVVCKATGLAYKRSMNNPKNGKKAVPAEEYSCRILGKKLYCKAVSWN